LPEGLVRSEEGVSGGVEGGQCWSQAKRGGEERVSVDIRRGRREKRGLIELG
jgi:hypothetical protein